MSKSESKSHFSAAMSWKTRLALYMGSAITDTAQRPDGTVNRRLVNVLDLKSHPNPHPINFVKTSDVPVDPCRNLWFRVFTPTSSSAAAASRLPLLVFFHGGGFAYLSPASKSYDAVCRRFARRIPAVVASVNYRLSPEYRYPCQYEDGFDVLRFLDQNCSVLPENVDLARCFLAGDSAGANLAHHVAVSACKAEFRRVKIVGLVSIQPFFGGVERTEAEVRLTGAPLVSVKRTDWLWRVFLPEGADRDHGAVNVSGPRAEDITGLDFPDTVVFVGGSDPLQDWQRRYGEWLRRSGKRADIIEYPNMIHAFYVFPELPQASQLIDQVKDFVSIRLSTL